MDRSLKSIAYAFASCDINIYLPDGEDNCFMIEKAVCAKCGQYWHTSLNECYLCGELNYYIFTCLDCGKQYSITNSTQKCSCGSPNLVYKCQNSDCISNTDSQVAEIANAKGGVFVLGSSFSVSLTHCVSCGNATNNYKSYRIFPVAENEYDVQKFIDSKRLKENDVVILKTKDIAGKITYKTASFPDFCPNQQYDSIRKIVDALYLFDIKE